MRFSELDGAKVGVWGAGREVGSFATQLAKRLPSARIAVAVFDSPPPAQALQQLRSPGVTVLGAGEAVAGLGVCDVVVRSPGVSIHRPELRALRGAGVPVTTPTALWLEEYGGAGVVGVSGTKGKSTTAALLHHLALAAGHTAQLAGNIGIPALELLDHEPAEIVVLELSSYQIADLAVGPEVALLTNLFREHTDWHGSEEAYRADKLRLLELPGVSTVVLNAREQALAALNPRAALRPYGTPAGWDVGPGGVTSAGVRVLELDELPLPGEHNALNLCGALTALAALGLDAPIPLGEALADFRALAHRLETVAEHGGVTWVNDSISTTPESTLAALASFPGRELVLIAGGQDRGQDYGELGRMLAELGATVIGVPSTGPRLLEAARAAGVSPQRALEAENLAEAVALARAHSKTAGVVLLSPAAPSYDHYRDFEQRGERFSELV
ncbi:MAG TPA: UDP-N-acetylmuramoyl-L-alanine--D-glutamate ligase [Solirubrobacteraceae bacterium]|nr:UDP-N-acetylmuramoyl-L-alanine--D-glutamate ligase [Solirubrobacteraceae bacterium]